MRTTIEFLTWYFLTLSSLITLHIHLSIDFPFTFDFMLVFRCSLCSPPYNNAHLYCHMNMSLRSKWHSMMTKGSFFFIIIIIFFEFNSICLPDWSLYGIPRPFIFFPTSRYQSLYIMEPIGLQLWKDHPPESWITKHALNLFSIFDFEFLSSVLACHLLSVYAIYKYKKQNVGLAYASLPCIIPF